MTNNEHPIARTLLAVIDNQAARTAAALENVKPTTLTADPGNGCNSILKIMHHLVRLRRFQLTLMESPLAAKIADPEAITGSADLLAAMSVATEIVREAIRTHDADDWFRTPNPAREGRWGDEATMMRLVRPLNDFTNHLGAIRAIRRILGDPVERTQ